MDRADWQRVGDEWMGPGMMSARVDEGWGARDLVLAAVALLVAALLFGALVAWRPWRRGLPA